MARIAELVTYPVKGCAGTPLRSADLTRAGLAHDRTFMVVDEEGVFRSQRRDPRMARIRPEAAEGGARLVLNAPGVEPLDLKTDPEGPRTGVLLHKRPFTGLDQGDGAAEWLSEVLGARSRLVRVPPDHDRRVSGLTPGTSGYADSTALMVLSLSSLDLLNERICAAGGAALPMNRFRPNIVVSGWADPHTEDRVRTARAGTAELGYAKVCIRCAVTTVDQETGEKTGPEPLRTLAGYRRADGGGVSFGAKFSVVRPGALAVGDPFEATAWDAPEQGLGERLAAVLG
ncbi:MOSC N-terminal beta barrel domain-containing protein [Nocardiopsis sp. CNT-189]|uniref:MOSC domain-containing protein n=1 Tax=Nocardiopsis oceanisediminis TaxID=2816862 RepID=UPI003B2A42D7